MELNLEKKLENKSQQSMCTASKSIENKIINTEDNMVHRLMMW